MKKIIISILTMILCVGSLLMPISQVFAEGPTTTPVPTLGPPAPSPTGGAATPTATPSPGNAAASSAIGSAGSCSAGALIGEAVAGIVTGLVGKVVNTTQVPITHDGIVPREGVYLFGVRVLPSWDAIAYCIGNALIQYVGDATINWINSGGTNGGSAFVADPQQFFTGIADQAAGGFVQGIIQGTTGVNICAPFQYPAALGTLNSYNGSFDKQSSCSLQQATANINGLLAGQAQYQTLSALHAAFGDTANNYMGVQSQALNHSYQLQAQAYTIQHDKYLINGQYEDIVSCDSYVNVPDPNNPNLSYVQPAPGAHCKTSVTGRDVEVQAQNTRNLPNLRLVATTKFDQVIVALVNQLIKVALDKLNQASTAATSATASH